MTRTVYLNGEFVAEQDAKVSVFDRGFLFADAVYEVSAVLNGRLLDNAAHLARLARSCQALDLRLPCAPGEIEILQNRLIAENNLREGAVYLQISRGNSGDRDFDFPGETVSPTFLMFTQARPLIHHPKSQTGIRMVSVDDIRWQRRDIKTVGLLAPCLAKEYAHKHDADDALLVENGLITEASSSNAWIVDAGGTLITRPLSTHILHGITRRALLELAKQNDLRFEERPFTLEEAQSAREIFISSATTFIWPVVSLNGKAIGDGKPGDITAKLREIYVRMAVEVTGGVGR
ncbi:D-amino-acid transaminase [Rahnella sp. BCC 1045]|jgi:D-alanine transaminase|uniref:D-amino-acid transaminase n=1 Tax=Rahnella sp. BCC 1045 TaxID=2816251 RepID=UPI001C274AAC|nr:D-amino-acid transaminase [Rahnella sp. BCC 1045]MBU9820568.1 D-amino-acid transaminase [Rahnella sp. BCC 1045]